MTILEFLAALLELAGSGVGFYGGLLAIRCRRDGGRRDGAAPAPGDTVREPAHGGREDDGTRA